MENKNTKKVTLTEEMVKKIVKEAVLSTLNEGFFNNMFNNDEKRAEEANDKMKLDKLRSILLQNNFTEKRTPKKIHGDIGFLFSCPRKNVYGLAKQLKSEGIRFQTVDNGRGENADAISKFFVCFAPYFE